MRHARRRGKLAAAKKKPPDGVPGGLAEFMSFLRVLRTEQLTLPSGSTWTAWTASARVGWALPTTRRWAVPTLRVLQTEQLTLPSWPTCYARFESGRASKIG